MPLAPFGHSLFAWAFGTALNSSLQAPFREFEYLIRFNRLDWTATRVRLLQIVDALPPVRSPVGEWSIIRILRATGSSDDAILAERKSESLVTKPAGLKGWRLVETYCETDPLDPLAIHPANIKGTAERYAGLAVDTLGTRRGMSSDDHFFEMALPGIARFEPEVGALVLRQLATQMLTREGIPRWLAILRILPSSALLDQATARELVSAAQRSDPAESEVGHDAKDEWATSYHLLFAAAPHLSGNDQLVAIAGMNSENVLLNFLRTMRPADEALVESLIEAAASEDDKRKLVRVFSAIMYSGSHLSDAAKGHVKKCLLAQNRLLRTTALGIAATTKDPMLLQAVAESGWDANVRSPDSNSVEAWYGSSSILEAARHGLIDLTEALDRMAVTHYGFAGAHLGIAGASAVADRIDAALSKALNLQEISELPDMERNALEQDFFEPPFVDLSTETPSGNPDQVFSLSTETDDKFRERQQRVRQAYQRFTKNLSNADAELVLADLTFEGMEAIVSAKPEIIERWYTALIGANVQKKRSLHLFAIHLASAIAKDNGNKAADLFRDFANVRPLVRHVTGYSKTPVEVEATWSHASNPDIASICLHRLERADSDSILATEVLAAFRAGHEDSIANYIQRLIDTGEPTKISRAITIAGFSDECDFATRILSQYNQARGLIGESWEAATFAYNRNVWARHWYFEMAKAKSPIDFWRYSILLTKVVDGRLDLWINESAHDTIAQAFFPTIRGEIEQRIKRWKDKRQGMLFGGKTPPAVFLSP